MLPRGRCPYPARRNNKPALSRVQRRGLGTVITSEYFFPSSSGQALIHVNQWTPCLSPVRGVVQLAHGVSEYGRRYEPFARFLCENGFAVLAHDHLGHGLSAAEGQPRIYFGPEHGWDYVVEDLASLQQRTARVFGDVPYFLFGHSMGSFITRTYLIRHPGTVRGAVLCGTGHQSPLLVAAGKQVVAGEIRKLGPAAHSVRADSLVFGSYNKKFAPARTRFDWISADPGNVDAYIADPMCGEDATLGLMRDMLEGIAFLTREESIRKMDKSLSVFFISGDEDPVGDMGRGVERACRAFRRAGLRDVSIKLYHGLRHEILNEKSRRFVYQDVLDWLTARLQT